jgi:hypothetical protein
MQFDQWVEVCDWIKANTPEDAVFLTPRYSNTLKWRADRAEVVTWKDVPQDAEHLNQWWQRHIALHQRPIWTETYRWRETPVDDGWERLFPLAHDYNFQYVVLEKLPNNSLPDDPPLFKTGKGGYAVYSIKQLEEAHAAK